MFTKNLIILCLIVLVIGKTDNCRKLLVDSDKFDAECCVFMKKNHVRHEHKKPLSTVIKVKVEDFEDSKYETYEPLTSLNVDSNKLYGQCVVYIKDQWVKNKNNEIVKAMVNDNLPSLLYNKMQEVYQRPNDITTSDFFFKTNAKHSSQNNKKTFSSAAFDTRPHEELGQDIEKNNLDIDQRTIVTNKKQNKTNSIPNMSFSTDNSENTAKNETNGNMEIGNRNAVNVPPIGCPNGKTRDPSGLCITSF